MSITDPIETNIAGVRQLVGSKINKLSADGTTEEEGVQGELIDELALDMTDEELLALAKKIETSWAQEEGPIKQRQLANQMYYLGKQKTGSPEAVNGIPVSDNIIFEAVETFVPAALAKNPEPVVFCDNTKEGDALAEDVKTMLQYHAENLNMRSQINLMTRKWLMDLLAVMKHGWDDEIQDIIDDVRDVKNFVFDENGYIDVYGHYVGTLGERISSTAGELVDLFPDFADFISVMVDAKMGTQVTRTEWWNDKYSFTTFKGKVLEKYKNPNYNYATTEKGEDEEGSPTEETQEGNNHFARPIKPYTFLSVFTFGEKPHDVTGLIEQAIPNQMRITKRTEQIDFNLSRQNNSDVFSENNFNQETGKQAKNALAKGNPVLVPQGGPIGEAIVRLQAQGLDASFFNDLENQKTALRMGFGTEGLTASPPDKNELATGIIANQQHDGSRIGGGIGDALERVAKSIFNYHVQLYYVFYDEEHVASIMGQMQAVEYATLSSKRFNKKIIVSVSPDSMKPRDEVSEMNQAVQLYEAKALDPKTLLTKVKFPDPQNTSEQTVLWLLDPQAYMAKNFPEAAQAMQQSQQAQQAQQQQQMQAEQQAAQAQQQQQGQAAQQQMQVKGAQAQQDMQIKQQVHEQKLRHQEEAHKSKEQAAKTAALKDKTKKKSNEKV